jgi:hypothetical protein
MELVVPDDPLLLQAMARVSILHSQLEFVLRMTMKALSKSRPNSARKDARDMLASDVRKRVRKLASKRLGKCDARDQLDALLDRCRRATKKRDKYAHAMFVGNFDRDDYLTESEIDDWAPLPSLSELTLFAAELFSLAEEIDEARLSGFLKDALGAESGRTNAC